VGTFAVPVINFIAPVIATAFMVHVFERLSHVPPSGALGGGGHRGETNTDLTWR